MKSRLKNNKGITLIALVITIIVLLILAGVAISMLAGDNGILRQAARAKEKTQDGQQKESSILENYEDIINEELNGIPEETDVTKLTAEGGVKQKTKYKDTSSVNTTSKTAVIPKGFRVSDEEDSDGNPTGQNIDTGLVVIAPDGSEFVWVPVDDITKMYDETNKRGILYNDGDITKPIPSTGYREPDVLTSTSDGDWVTGDDTKGIGLLKSIVGLTGTDDEIKTKWTKELRDEFDKMINSVRTNKGFYVSRYEMSLREKDGEKIAQSKKGVKSATNVANSCNTWYGLYQKSKEYSEKNNLETKVGSSMIWGSQYDQMMIWMKANNIDVSSSTPIEGAVRNLNGTTGTKEEDKLNNVYDLLGNSYEWTLEARNTDNRERRRR